MPDAPGPQSNPLERAHRRRRATALAMWMAVVFVLFALLSRLGLLARFPWLSTEAPGAVATRWLSILVVKTVAGALVAGIVGYQLIRLPPLRDRAGSG